MFKLFPWLCSKGGLFDLSGHSAHAQKPWSNSCCAPKQKCTGSQPCRCGLSRRLNHQSSLPQIHAVLCIGFSAAVSHGANLATLADDDRHGAHHQSVMVWCRRHIVLSSTRVARMYGRCKSWIERLCGAELVFFGLRQALSFWRLADPGPNEPYSLRIRFTGSPKASCFHFYAGRHAVASCCMRCPC